LTIFSRESRECRESKKKVEKKIKIKKYCCGKQQFLSRSCLNISRLNLPNGEPLFFSNTDVRVYGKNRTPLAVVTGIFIWPCLFIPGTKAVMPAGYEVQATVAANTVVTLK
jgi:hypothetical protein